MTYIVKKLTHKRNGNFNLYIEDYEEEKIQIHCDVVVIYAIHKGMEIDKEKFDEILRENDYYLCKQKALQILTASAKTKKEIIMKLRTARYSSESIDRVLEFLERYKFINDEEVAQSLSENKYRKKRYSKRKIQASLKEKGITNSVVNKLTEDITEEEELENAIYYANKKYRTLKNKPIEEIKRKIYSSLNYRGFNFSIAKKAVEHVLKEED